jgi:hypothetical protein
VIEDVTNVRVVLAYVLGKANFPEDLAMEIDGAVETGIAFARILDDGSVILLMSDGAFLVTEDGLARIEQPHH